MSQQNQLQILLQEGLSLQKQGNVFKAQQLYEKILDIDPNFVDAIQLLGTLFAQNNQFQKAFDYLNKAITIDPLNAIAHSNLSLVLLELNRLNEALISCDKAISIIPDYAFAYNNRGNILKKLNRLNEAIISYDRAISIRSDFAEAYNNRAMTLKNLNLLDEALKSCNKAISIKPDFAKAYNNRGIILHNLKYHDEAITNYKKAIKINPDYAETYYNLSLTNLLLGNYKDGFQEYEWRWKVKNRSEVVRNFKKPLWLGKENINNKTILLHAEQGLGDTIQFCRYIPMVAKLGAKIILEIQPSLFNLIKDTNSLTQVIKKGEDLPSFDYHCPLLSLPLAFQTELRDVPPPLYFNKNENKIIYWQNKLGKKTKPRIGIVWSSTSNFAEDFLRSVTLKEFLQSLPKENFEYICLQKEIKEIDKETLKKNSQIKFFGEEINDFSDDRNLIECLDLIISTCTSIPHLSCSLGKETWLLLSYVPNWRWLLFRNDSPWYPSAKLYRQTKINDWENVFKQINLDLKKKFEENFF